MFIASSLLVVVAAALASPPPESCPLFVLRQGAEELTVERVMLAAGQKWESRAEQASGIIL